MLTVTVLLGLLAAAACTAEAHVVVLTDDTFAAKTATGTWFVEFYAPWCGWCKRLAPVWDELGSEFDDASGTQIAKLDCIAEPKTCNLLGVKSFPTLKLFKDGKIRNFAGGQRTLETLRDFVTRDYKEVKDLQDNPFVNKLAGAGTEDIKLVQTDAADEVLTALTEQNFADRVSGGSKWLVAATAPWCGHCKVLHPTLVALAAQKGLDFEVGNVNCDEDAELCRQLGVTSFPTLSVVAGGRLYGYTGERSLERIKQFARSDYAAAPSVPLPVQVSEAVLPKRRGLRLLDGSTFDEATAHDPWLVGFSCSSPECGRMEEALAQLQKSYSVHLRIGLVDCAASESAALCTEYGITAPPAAVLLYRDRVFTHLGPDFGSADLTLFVGEGFKTAPTRVRKHLPMVRRLGWKTFRVPATLEDFFRQNRYVLVASVLLGLVVWGILLGSALSHSPRQVVASYRRWQEMQQQQSAKKKK